VDPQILGATGDLAPWICEALTLRQVPILNLIEIRNVFSDKKHVYGITKAHAGLIEKAEQLCIQIVSGTVLFNVHSDAVDTCNPVSDNGLLTIRHIRSLWPLWCWQQQIQIPAGPLICAI